MPPRCYPRVTPAPPNYGSIRAVIPPDFPSDCDEKSPTRSLTMHATVSPIGESPIPLHRPTAVLTPRGHAALSIVRLEYQLAELAPADRAYCLDLLRDLIEEATV